MGPATVALRAIALLLVAAAATGASALVVNKTIEVFIRSALTSDLHTLVQLLFCYTHMHAASMVDDAWN